MPADEEGHIVALGAWFRVALAIAAWIAWAAITHDATKPGSFFGLVLLDDFLASLFVSSLVGTVISLFPLRFLPGEKLKAWHLGAWAATFVATLFVLVQVLLRPHSTSSGPSHTPLVTTIVLFALFAGASLLFRDHFARKRRAAGDKPPAPAAGTSVAPADTTATAGPVERRSDGRRVGGDRRWSPTDRLTQLRPRRRRCAQYSGACDGLRHYWSYGR